MTDKDGILIDNFHIDDIPHDILKKIYLHWLKMKGDRLMPSRADLNPADIVDILPNICLVDAEKETKRYKMRLIGTETVRAIGTDITGKYLDEVPLMEQHLKKRYDWIKKEKRPYLISGKLRWSKLSFLNFCSIGLPFSDDGENVDIIMYGSCYTYPIEDRTEYMADPSWND